MKESRYNVWLDVADASYVFNGMTGALLRVSRDDRVALAGFLAGKATCRPTTLLELTRGRMLVPDDLDEFAMLRRRYQASQHDASHLSLTLVTSLGCNFDCPYCFESKHPSLLESETQQAVLALVDDRLPTLRSFSVTWFGGEPLLGKKALLCLSDAFIERCHRAAVEYSADIVTNGYRLDETTCRELRDRQIRSAQVSLDGPPEIHDGRRPLVGGQGTFWRIVKNLHHAVQYLTVSVRINVDWSNIAHTEELLRVLAGEGLAGKVEVNLGQVVAVSDGAPAPSSTYRGRCLSGREFAKAQQDFDEILHRHGFPTGSLPEPTGAPCTAVRANELVIGSRGELYKCWDSVGNPAEVVGDIRTYREANGRLRKWLAYDPFADAECQGCFALPVCMGGCAHHALDARLYDNRCSPFRETYREQIVSFIGRRMQADGQQPAVGPPAG